MATHGGDAIEDYIERVTEDIRAAHGNEIATAVEALLGYEIDLSDHIDYDDDVDVDVYSLPGVRETIIAHNPFVAFAA
ncbi:hypothetical protein [Mycolicibacterium lutetiense]|nr:hypothetical protein [Mycolicibacterium lutetiense]